MVLRGCIAFHIMYQPLENQMMQWTAHDHMESKGWWNQQTLQHTFSKSYLVTGPPQPTLLHIAEGDKAPVVHIKICWDKQPGSLLPQAKANPCMVLLFHTWFCFSSRTRVHFMCDVRGRRSPVYGSRRFDFRRE